MRTRKNRRTCRKNWIAGREKMSEGKTKENRNVWNQDRIIRHHLCELLCETISRGSRWYCEVVRPLRYWFDRIVTVAVQCLLFKRRNVGYHDTLDRWIDVHWRRIAWPAVWQFFLKKKKKRKKKIQKDRLQLSNSIELFYFRCYCKYRSFSLTIQWDNQ